MVRSHERLNLVGQKSLNKHQHTVKTAYMRSLKIASQGKFRKTSNTCTYLQAIDQTQNCETPTPFETVIDTHLLSIQFQFLTVIYNRN